MQIDLRAVGVVGTGALGRGIAQKPGQAGSQIVLFDLQPGTAKAAQTELTDTWQMLVTQGALEVFRQECRFQRLTCFDARIALFGCHQMVGAVAECARRLGPTAVSAPNTPGFIVNHVGPRFSTEALRVANERMTDSAAIDGILKDQMGLRLGPFELIDLTALDVPHPGMKSICLQYLDQPRYRLVLITAQQLAGGVVSKGVGQGFYTDHHGSAVQPPEAPVPSPERLPLVWVSPKAARRAGLHELLKAIGVSIKTGSVPPQRPRSWSRPWGCRSPRWPLPSNLIRRATRTSTRCWTTPPPDAACSPPNPHPHRLA